MGKQYLKPELKAYTTGEICEIIGPLQANYLHLYLQQVENPEIVGKLSNKTEQVQMVAENTQSEIYNYSTIA